MNARVAYLTALAISLLVLAVGARLVHSTARRGHELCQQVPAHVPHPRPLCYWVPEKGGALRPAS